MGDLDLHQGKPELDDEVELSLVVDALYVVDQLQEHRFHFTAFALLDQSGDVYLAAGILEGREDFRVVCVVGVEGDRGDLHSGAADLHFEQFADGPADRLVQLVFNLQGELGVG